MKLVLKNAFVLLLTACSYNSFAQQVYEADNGVTASGSGTTRKVSLGGNLTGHTSIGLGTYNLNLTGTGNVGIRTGSPFAPLHVYKNTATNYNPVMILEDGLDYGYVMFQMKGTGHTYHLGLGNNTENYFGLANKFFIWDQDAQLPRFVLDPTGNIGIGTTSPTSRLSIAGATAGTSGLHFTQLNNTATAGTGNGKVLSLDASGNVILVNDVGGAGTVWPLLGANGTNPATHFLGTTDNQDLVFRTNNVERSRLLANGNLLLGTTTDNSSKLQVDGHIYSKGLKLDAGEYIYWQDNNTSIRRTTDNQLVLQEYTGLIRMQGVTSFSLEMKHPSYGSAWFTYPSNKNFQLKHEGSPVLLSSAENGNTFIKLGAGAPQYADNRGVHLYLFGGTGGYASAGFDGGNVYIDGGVKGGTTKADGNILIGTQQGNVLIGQTTDNGSKLQVTGDIVQWGNYSTTFGNGIRLDMFETKSRIFSNGKIHYQGNSPTDQHIFINQIGTAFSGTLVTVDPGNSNLGDNQLSLKVLGKSGTIGLNVNMLGYTGIGTITPAAQLHTTGTVRFAGLANDNALTRVVVSDASGNLSYRDASTLGGSGTTGWALAGNSNPGAGSFIGTTDATPVVFKANNIEGIRIGTNGNVGIGTASITGTDYKLYVQGNIRTRKVRVDQDTWSDYVFDKEYQLPTLAQVERYIQQHHHLPDVPSAAEVAKEGVDLGDNQAVLLKKIEELTLYVIEQNKLLKQQQERIDALEKKAAEKNKR